MHVVLPASMRDFFDVAVPQVNQIYVRATVTVQETFAIPAANPATANESRCWTFAAEGQAVQLAFNTNSSITISRTATATLGGGALTVNSQSTFFIPANTSLTLRIPPSITHMAHISTATTGFLRFYESGGEGR